MLGVGILGAGHIAGKMAETLSRMDSARAVAVGSRSVEKAQVFARRHGIASAYGSYEELVRDRAVDLVYVATPNSHHADHLFLALEHGKHVLGEKTFTLSSEQAERVFDCAARKNLYAAEALWTRYMPFMRSIARMLADGVVGKVESLNASFGNPVSDQARMTEPALGGGALLDLGVYLLHFATALLGDEVADVRSMAVPYHSGVDAQETMCLRYASGQLATLHATMLTTTDRCAAIYGDTGYLVVHKINNPRWARLYAPDHTLRQTFEPPPQITGFEYQVQAAVDAIAAGRCESDLLPHHATLFVLRLMEQVRSCNAPPAPPA